MLNELAVLDWIQFHMSSELMDKIMMGITKLGDGGAVWIALVVFLLLIPGRRKAGKWAGAALLLQAILCNLVLKPLVARPRPYEAAAYSILIAPPGGSSFPSGHTAAAFAVAAALFLAKDRLRFPAIVLAILVAFSRMYLYVHYPSDVFGGMLLGIGCAFLAKFWWERKSVIRVK